MARRIALFACLLSGCLRPVWAETAPSIRVEPAPIATAPVPARHSRELYRSRYDDEDHYQVTFTDNGLRRPDIYLFVTLREFYPIDCDWRGNTCSGELPRAARASRILLMREEHHECPPFRLLRDGVELEIAEEFISHCGYLLRVSP